MSGPALRVLLLGKDGLLGRELRDALARLGPVVATGRAELDVTRPAQLRRWITETAPDLIVNATAYTAVDAAESDPERAFAVNAEAPGILAEEAARHGIPLIHYSTDYVFDGSKGAPYVETDAPSPLNVYGRSKLEGERAVAAAGGAYLILRTGWLYGLDRDCFVTRVLGWARTRRELRIAEDQIGSPTWCRALAKATAAALERGWARAGTGDPGAIARVAGSADVPASGMSGGGSADSGWTRAAFADWIAERRGVYHLAGSGSATRIEWARAILTLDPRKEEQISSDVIPARAADFPTPARRPACSALDTSRFEAVFGVRLPRWEEALRMAMGVGAR